MTIGVLAVAGAILGAGIVAAIAYRRRTASKRALEGELEDRLTDKLGPGTGSHLERAPRVRRLATIDRRDGDPVYVPVVRVDLGTTDAPGMDLVFEYVAAVVEAIAPVFADRDGRVRCYDVEFAFGPDGLLVDGECRRVSVPPTLADRLLTDETYRAFDLRRDVERGDRDDEATVLWGACGRY